MNHWLYKHRQVEDIPEGAFGFVYLIESIYKSTSPHRYIGRKYLTKAAKRSIKNKNGTKRTKKVRVESDWSEYMGSCKPLLEDIKKYGKDKYRFTILAWGYTKGQVNALETICQIKANVMVDGSYYNEAVGSGMFRGVKFDDRFESIIQEL